MRDQDAGAGKFDRIRLTTSPRVTPSPASAAAKASLRASISA
jgi:hypothetical protein